MKIEIWPISRIIPYPKNARKIPQSAVDKVALSLREFGWQQPIVVEPNGVIIVGHVRRLGALQNGWTEAPVVVADKLSPEQIRAYRLMDNRSHEETGWDLSLLGQELQDIRGMEFGLELTGFDSREIDALLRTHDERADDAPPLPECAVTRPGDLWVMGEHRLLCGDATKSEDVTRACGNAKPFLMVTDPPYGVEYDPEWREEVSLNPRTVQGGKVSNDDRVDWSPAWHLFPGDVAYVWHAGIYAGEVAASLFTSQFQIRGQIIWRKQHFVISRGAYHWQHEPCWYAVRKGKSAQWHGDRTQSTVWDVQNLSPLGGNKDEKKTGHGTQKPIELMRRPILNHTKAGAVVYDPFLGSGSTLIAAQELERRCLAIDIDPLYCDVAVLRWQNFTGREATLEGHGATFHQVKQGRRLEADDGIKEEVLETLANQ